MSITVERFITGPIETNTYLVIDSRECVIIDPSAGVEVMISRIRDRHLEPQAIVITHGHFDHIIGIPEVIEAFPLLPVYIHPDERIMLTDPRHNLSFGVGEEFRYDGLIRDLEEGAVSFGAIKGTVFMIPGHSPAGCAILIENFLFCGDILFPGGVGRTDFPGGDGKKLIDGIIAKLMPLDDAVTVCPGHMGRTTIGRERRLNPYLK